MYIYSHKQTPIIMASILESTEKYFSINGAVFPLNSCSVTKIANGIRVVILSKEQVLDVAWKGSAANGEQLTSASQLYNWFKENCFSLTGGGDGMGSQLPDDFFMENMTVKTAYLPMNSTDDETTVPLFEPELNQKYGSMSARFIVFADNVGSGMAYYKKSSGNNSQWQSWATSRAIDNQ